MLEESYRKEYKSDPEFLPEIEQYIISILEKENFSDEIINNLSLSVAEAASNSIIHGNKLDPSKKIQISLNIYKDKVQIIIKDEGKGFNPKSVPNPTAPENIMKESGRGIHIMKTFLDSLDYNFTPEGTEVILTVKKNK